MKGDTQAGKRDRILFIFFQFFSPILEKFNYGRIKGKTVMKMVVMVLSTVWFHR